MNWSSLVCLNDDQYTLQRQKQRTHKHIGQDGVSAPSLINIFSTKNGVNENFSNKSSKYTLPYSFDNPLT